MTSLSRWKLYRDRRPPLSPLVPSRFVMFKESMSVLANNMIVCMTLRYMRLAIGALLTRGVMGLLRRPKRSARHRYVRHLTAKPHVDVHF